jgi:hypothetical protein
MIAEKLFKIQKVRNDLEFLLRSIPDAENDVLKPILDAIALLDAEMQEQIAQVESLIPLHKKLLNAAKNYAKKN